MRRILLSLAALIALATTAQAQCVAVGGVNSVPQTGVNCPSEPSTNSFAASGYGIVPASAATDIACLTGSATKVVRLQSVRVSGTAGTLVTLPVLLNLHTIANTGGTPATSTALPVPFKIDTQDLAATATTTAYTANPTVDASANIMEVQAVSFNTTSALVAGNPAFFDYKERNFIEAPTLRGIAQQACVNLGGISITSGLLAVSFVWTEAPQ